MSRPYLSSMPMPMLAVVLIMGTLGIGRSLLVLLLSWSAYQAGAVELHGHAFFIVHFAVGVLVLGVSVGLVIRMRWAWVAAVLVSTAMLIEEIARAAPLLAAERGVSPTVLASALYVASMVAMIALLTKKSSRDFLQQAD